MALACEYRQSDPIHPKGVPQQAVWVGGPDGGVFVEVRPVPSNTNTYMVTIYHDRTGIVLYHGLAELRPAGGEALKVDDPTAFSGWDGEKMILADGRTLEPKSSGRH